MTEPQKTLEDRIRAARSSQEIAELQASRSGLIQRMEGSVPAASGSLWTSTVQPGRVRIHSERDGDVDLPIDQLENALRVDSNLKITAIGSNAEMQKRIDECRDTNELAQLMVQARQGQI
jgi:hypothetical protein